jgi:hypothetical protein
MFQSYASTITAIAVAAGMATSATAAITVSPTILTVEVSSGGFSGFVNIPASAGFAGPNNFFYFQPTDIDIVDFNDGVTVLATLRGTTITAADGSFVLPSHAAGVFNIGYNITAASSLDINVNVRSGTIGFDAVPIPGGNVSAGLVGDDLNGNGASMTGLFPGADAFRTYFNGDPTTGTLFTSGINGTASGVPNSTIAFPDFFTPDPLNSSSDFVGMPGPIDSMSMAWNFSLSRGDVANANSLYRVLIIPAPGAAGLFAIVGLVGLRRRR